MRHISWFLTHSPSDRTPTFRPFPSVGCIAIVILLPQQRYAAFKNTKSKIGNARRTEMLNQGRIDHRQVLKDQKLASRKARGYDK